MEIVPGVHRFKVPLEGTELGGINVYLLEGPRGSIVIDTGWDAPGVWEELLRQFEADGVKTEDITDVVVTHIHPDHYGLTSRFKQATGARIVMHPREEGLIRDVYIDHSTLLDRTAEMLRNNGFDAEIHELARTTSILVNLVHGVPNADRRVEDGEVISNGEFDLRAVWTPGHAQGHICLYDPERKLLFTGDHVLPDITSHIGVSPLNPGNPLRDYLASLRKVRDLSAGTMLPAHGELFTDLRSRVDRLLHHHEEREADILGVLNCTPKTAHQIAAGIIWLKDQGGRTFDRLKYADKRLAIMETLSHLELMLSEGKIRSARENGRIAHVRAGC